MLKIADLINRYSKLTVPHGILRAKVAEIIKNEFDFDIPLGKIKLQRNIIFIDCSPVLKCELQMKKKVILEKLRAEIGDKIPTDIS